MVESSGGRAAAGETTAGRTGGPAPSPPPPPPAPLQTSPPAEPDGLRPSREALLAEYAQVCQSWRWLADIRFKLLGLLPLSTFVAAALNWQGLVNLKVVMSLFGLLVTIAVVTYNERNDQHYNELVGRAAHLERDLKLFDGSFNQRPGTWRRFGRVEMATRVLFAGLRVEHGWPVRLVYQASAGVWLYLVLSGALEFGRWRVLGVEPESFDPSRPYLNAGVGTLCALLVGVVSWRLSATEARQRKGLKADVMALHGLLEAFLKDPRATEPELFRTASIARLSRLVRGIKGDDQGEEAKLEAAIRFYAGGEGARYVPPSGPAEAAAYVLAQIIGMPARWIHDVAKRGK